MPTAMRRSSTEATRALRGELLELDVDDVERPCECSPPPDARGLEAGLLGTLFVTAGEADRGAVRTIASWLGRRSDRSVKLQIGDDTIELTAASVEDQQRLIDAFVARHSPMTDAGGRHALIVAVSEYEDPSCASCGPRPPTRGASPRYSKTRRSARSTSRWRSTRTRRRCAAHRAVLRQPAPRRPAARALLVPRLKDERGELYLRPPTPSSATCSARPACRRRGSTSRSGAAARAAWCCSSTAASAARSRSGCAPGRPGASTSSTTSRDVGVR